MTNLKAVESVPQPLKLDLGCGKNKRDGFVGVDSRPFPGVDITFDLVQQKRDGSFLKWMWNDSSVAEAHCSHFIEHLTPPQRIHFVNELYRVLVPGGTCYCLVPHWASARAYGDLTHQWPPVSEFWLPYLNAEWRAANAPHNDSYTCDFDTTSVPDLHPALRTRNQEFQQFAVHFFKEATQDMHFTLISRKKV